MISAASALCPRPRPSTTPAAIAMTFFSAAADLDADRRRRCRRAGKSGRGTPPARARSPHVVDDAATTAVGSCCATSIAKLGPEQHDDRMRRGPASCAITSDIRSNVSGFEPLGGADDDGARGRCAAQPLGSRRGTPCDGMRRHDEARVATARRASSCVTATLGGQRHVRQVHRVGAARRSSPRPARRRGPTAGRRGRRAPRWTASAVPQLPAPRIVHPVRRHARGPEAAFGAGHAGAQIRSVPEHDQRRGGDGSEPTTGAGTADARRQSAAAPASPARTRARCTSSARRRRTNIASARRTADRRQHRETRRTRVATPFAAAESQPDRDKMCPTIGRKPAAPAPTRCR